MITDEQIKREITEIHRLRDVCTVAAAEDDASPELKALILQMFNAPRSQMLLTRYFRLEKYLEAKCSEDLSILAESDFLDFDYKVAGIYSYFVKFIVLAVSALYFAMIISLTGAAILGMMALCVAFPTFTGAFVLATIVVTGALVSASLLLFPLVMEKTAYIAQTLLGIPQRSPVSEESIQIAGSSVTYITDTRSDQEDLSTEANSQDKGGYGTAVTCMRFFSKESKALKDYVASEHLKKSTSF